MLRICNSIVKLTCALFGAWARPTWYSGARHEPPDIPSPESLVPCLLAPVAYRGPVCGEALITHRLLIFYLQPREFKQSPELVRVNVLYELLIGELRPSDLPHDACLQSALNRIAGQIIRAIKETRIQQRLCLANPCLGQPLKIGPGTPHRNFLYLIWLSTRMPAPNYDLALPAECSLPTADLPSDPFC